MARLASRPAILDAILANVVEDVFGTLMYIWPSVFGPSGGEHGNGISALFHALNGLYKGSSLDENMPEKYNSLGAFSCSLRYCDVTLKIISIVNVRTNLLLFTVMF